MPASSFVNYYQMLGIMEKEDCTTARAKVKAALIFSHPDKHPSVSKDLYTEKSAVLSTGLQIFSDEINLAAWRWKYYDELRKWFRSDAVRNEKPMDSHVPAEYLRWLKAGAKWYELKNIMKWWAVQRSKAAKLEQDEAVVPAATAQRIKAARLKQDKAPAAAIVATQSTTSKARTDKRRTRPTETSRASKTVLPSQRDEQDLDARTFTTRPSEASRPEQRPRKKTKRHRDSQEQPKPTLEAHRSSRPPTKSYYTCSTFNGQECIIIDDSEDPTGPSSRTRSKMSWAAAVGPGSYRANLGGHANIPGYNIPTRKRKRTTMSEAKASVPETTTATRDTSKEDISFASLFAERVRTPY